MSRKRKRRSAFLSGRWCPLCRKRVRRNREEAERAVGAAQRDFGREARNMNAYQCEMGYWHIGRMRGAAVARATPAPEPPAP